MTLLRRFYQPRPLFIASLTAFLLFCALGLLVRQGGLKPIDTYAVQHLMPYGDGLTGQGTSRFAQLVAYKGQQFHAGRALRVPASALPSVLLIAILSIVLWRAGRRRLALLWLAALDRRRFGGAHGQGHDRQAKP